MILSKQQAVEEHRKMWNWIADETIKRKTIVTKETYFDEVRSDLKVFEYPLNLCFCCDYDLSINCSNICIYCPIIWPNNNGCEDILYFRWQISSDYEEAAEFARLIAERPEREDTEFDIV